LRPQIARDIAQAQRFFNLLRRTRAHHSAADTPVPLMPQP
jgi:hypothetical protein